MNILTGNGPSGDFLDLDANYDLLKKLITNFPIENFARVRINFVLKEFLMPQDPDLDLYFKTCHENSINPFTLEQINYVADEDIFKITDSRNYQKGSAFKSHYNFDFWGRSLRRVVGFTNLPMNKISKLEEEILIPYRNLGYVFNKLEYKINQPRRRPQDGDKVVFTVSQGGKLKHRYKFFSEKPQRGILEYVARFS